MTTVTVASLKIDKKEIIADFNSFFAEKDGDTPCHAMLSGVFRKVAGYIENRFVEMNNGELFDRKVAACWPGLKDNRYLDTYFDSGSDSESVLAKMRAFYRSDNIDLPTKKELLALAKLDSAPFELHNGRPGSPSCYILFKTGGGKVQGFDTDRSGLNNVSSGMVRPIRRLYREDCGNLSDRRIFQLWLVHGLCPAGFSDEGYAALLDLEFTLDGLEITDIQGMSAIGASGMRMNVSESMIEEMRSVDHVRANLVRYDARMFFDVNQGSWEVFRRYARQQDMEGEHVTLALVPPLVGLDPAESIVDGVIGIDFGTKSTVVVYSRGREKIMPMRIGIGDWKMKEEAWHFENPTAMEFVDLSAFIKAYNSQEFRPYTKWADLTVSHTAYNNMRESHSDDFNAYLTELKQWAGDRKRRLRIEDLKKTLFEIPPLNELEDEDINPIELYAYYIGLYINNQLNGIYLDYILSFPVTYDMETRERILESFRRGMEKSLPDIGERINDLRVISGASEPAAYAAAALQEYGFDEKERTVYAVFDFGGGTTDFDFGVFRYAEDNRQEERYDYVIEHFGAGGDRFLGGENLLDLMAFEIFKNNRDIILEEGASFVLPPECSEFPGSETLLSGSREARLNMVNLSGRLRPFWERESFDEEMFGGRIEVDLYNNSGELKSSVALDVDENRLKELLEQRIGRGIDNFFESLKEALAGNADLIYSIADRTVNIFLAGNASKSPLVEELFRKKIKEIMENEDSRDDFLDNFEIFPPLDNKGDFERPNGKTGVAFGLVETRPGGVIKVVDRNVMEDEIRFGYYIGRNRRKKLDVILDRNAEYGEWTRFVDAGEEFFEVYYTSLPTAATLKLPIGEARRKKLRISETDPDLDIWIRAVSPTAFEYAVGNGFDFSEITRVELEE